MTWEKVGKTSWSSIFKLLRISSKFTRTCLEGFCEIPLFKIFRYPTKYSDFFLLQNTLRYYLSFFLQFWNGCCRLGLSVFLPLLSRFLRIFGIPSRCLSIIKAGQLPRRLSVMFAHVQKDPSTGGEGARRIIQTLHLLYSVEAKYFNRTGWILEVTMSVLFHSSNSCFDRHFFIGF